MMNLDKLRRKIDIVDSKILELLNQRAETSRKIGAIKQKKQSENYLPSREKEVLTRLKKANKGPLPDKYLIDIYREIFSVSRALQGPITVAYWGPEASFTHQAAHQHFGSAVRLKPIKTIPEVFSEVEKSRVDYGVVPVENSTEGIVNYTLDMFSDSELKICSEILLKISQNLLSKANSLKSIKRLYVNSQSLSQSRIWIEENLPLAEIHSVTTTSEAAKIVQNDGKGAAIASKLAAERYGLNILVESIEDSADNYTRFIVIGKQISPATGHDKTSIMVSIRDHVGALGEMLDPFRKHKINLTNIESRPSRRKAWDYYFFIDFEGHISDRKVAIVLNQLKERSVFLKVLGSYPKV